MIVHKKFEDLVDKEMAEDELARPDNEDEVAKRTMAALGKIVDAKVAHARPVMHPGKPQDTAQFFRHQGAGGAASQKIIRMVDVQKDPFEPPKFKHKKVPRGAPDAPVTVMHSPPKKLSLEERKMWEIPPCISNWKNNRGYIVPLDKRLAIDGRGSQEVQISDRFAKFAEVISSAEEQAKKEVSARSRIQKKLAIREKEAKELELKELAAQARAERARLAGRGERAEEKEDAEDVDKREQLRRERRYQHERDIRMQKRSKAIRDLDRDVSEKIALGQHVATGQSGGEVQYDSRLFNQDKGGFDSGFHGELDEEGDFYDKPLFAKKSESIYRPRAEEQQSALTVDELKSSKRFKPDKGFEGADAEEGRSRDRSEPVQFEIQRDEAFGRGNELMREKEREHRRRDRSRSRERKRSRSPRPRSRSPRRRRRSRSPRR